MIAHALLVVAANAALLAAGIGFLRLTRAWRRFGRWSRWIVALLAGQALFLAAAPLLLYARLSVSPAIVLPLAAGLFAAGLVRDRRAGPPPLPGGARREHAAPLAAALVALPLAVLAARSVAMPLYQVDAMTNWVMKAKMIWAGGGRLTGVLDPRMFARPDLHPQAHLEYPVGLNALLAWSFHWMGDADIRVVHLQLVLLVVGAVGTAWALLRPIVPELPLAVGLAGLALMPALVNQALTAYADVPLAVVWATGALALVRWTAEGDRSLLALATLLLAAALAVKQDGAFYDAAIFVGVAIAVLLLQRTRLVLDLLASAFVVMLTAVPWQAYAAAHGLRRHDVRPGLGRMRDQTGHLLPTLDGMLRVAVHPPVTLLAIPLSLALAVVCIVRRRRLEAAVPLLVCVAAVAAAILLVYWNSAVTLDAVLIPALPRIMMGLVVLAWLLVAPLAFAAVASPAEYGRTATSGDEPA